MCLGRFAIRLNTPKEGGPESHGADGRPPSNLYKYKGVFKAAFAIRFHHSSYGPGLHKYGIVFPSMFTESIKIAHRTHSARYQSASVNARKFRAFNRYREIDLGTKQDLLKILSFIKFAEIR